MICLDHTYTQNCFNLSGLLTLELKFCALFVIWLIWVEINYRLTASITREADHTKWKFSVETCARIEMAKTVKWSVDDHLNNGKNTQFKIYPNKLSLKFEIVVDTDTIFQIRIFFDGACPLDSFCLLLYCCLDILNPTFNKRFLQKVVQKWVMFKLCSIFIGDLFLNIIDGIVFVFFIGLLPKPLL